MVEGRTVWSSTCAKIEVEGTIYQQTVFGLKVDNRTPTLVLLKIKVEGFSVYQKSSTFHSFGP